MGAVRRTSASASVRATGPLGRYVLSILRCRRRERSREGTSHGCSPYTLTAGSSGARRRAMASGMTSSTDPVEAALQTPTASGAGASLTTARIVSAPCAGGEEKHDRVKVAELGVGKHHGVVLSLLEESCRCLGPTIKLDEQVQRRAAQTFEDPVPVSHDDAGEHLMTRPLAVPLREHPARSVCVYGEANEELVRFDVMRELLAVGHTSRNGMLPAKLGPVDAAMVSDEEHACLIENPVIWSGALTPWLGRAKAIEHSQGIEHIQARGCAPHAREMQTLDLARRQHTMLDAVDSDLPVTLGHVRSKTQHVLITEAL
jgi:hypothetical protein